MIETAPTGRNKAPLLILDPCCFSPFYNCNLTASLVSKGWPASLLTSKFPFEPMTTDEPNRKVFFYNRFPAAQLFSIASIHRHDLLRGTLKTFLYATEMIHFTKYLRRLGSIGIIHVQWANLPLIDKRLWSLWKRLGWKLVYTAHDPEPLPGTTNFHFFSADHTLLSLAEAILVHSRKAKDLLTQWGLNQSLIHEICMGPTLSSDLVPLSQDSAREKLGLPTDVPAVLFFGYIKPYKGLDLAIRAMPGVLSAVPETRLIVAGRLMEPRNRYQALIDQRDLGRSILWHPEFIPSRDIPIYFSAADIVITPYLQASSSSVISLAHYFCKPVIATRAGALGEQLKPERGDRIIAPGDQQQLADAIVTALCDSRAQAEHGSTVQQREGVYLREEAWAEAARQHEKIYTALLKS